MPPNHEIHDRSVPAADAPAHGRPEHAKDLALVRAILAGSAEAWQEMVERYSGLIQAVVRRYIYSRDEDDIRSVYVNVLESLHRRKLVGYQGRAALSTWLTLVARTEVLDFLRHRFGRRELPAALRALDAQDQRIFRLYYVEGRSFTEVLHGLPRDEWPWTIDRLLVALRRIEDRLDARWLRRLAYDLHAQSTGAASGRLLEYLDHVRTEYQENEGAHSPDYHLMERQARRTVERVRRMLDELPAGERQILTLRFERGWPAKRIADELGLQGPRSVYTIIERIIRVLRRGLGSRDRPED